MTTAPLIVREYAVLPYIDEIIKQRDVALEAVEALNAVSKGSSHQKYFGPLQSILASAGIVSKILWPSAATRRKGSRSQIAADRSAALLSILDVPPLPGLSLLEDRTIRNSIEHIDERIDDLVSSGRGYVDIHVGSARERMPGVKSLTHLRWYNPSTKTFTLLDDAINIQGLWNIMRDVGERAIDWRLTHYPDSPGVVFTPRGDSPS